MQKNILVIDDNSTICEIIDILFTEEGFKVKTLSNADTLSNELKVFSPDIFILDYLMPGKNGIEITKYIRSRPDTKNTPIVMIAANEYYKSEAKKAGINLFINKPFDIHELVYAVSNLIDRHRNI